MWITLLILMFCSLVQGMVGFAFSLFAVPLLLLTGYSLPQAVAMALLSSLVQKAVMIFRLRQSIQWRGILVPVLFMLLLLPVGIWILCILGASGSGIVKKILGGIVLLVLILRSAVKVHPHEKLHWGWGALAGGMSGFFQGLANTGGPPVVLWALAHDWPPERMRSVTPVLVILLAPFQVVMLHLAFGGGVWPSAETMVLVVPVVVLATASGIRLGGHLHVDLLRRVITALLILLAIVLLFDPLSFLRG